MSRKAYWPESHLETFEKGNGWACAGHTWCPGCHRKELNTSKRADSPGEAVEEARADLRRKLRDHLKDCTG